MIEFSLSRSEFRHGWFEQRPLLLKGAYAVRGSGWELIDRALDLQDPTRELLKVLLQGRIDPATYVEEFVDIGIRRRRVMKDRLYALVQQGATLVLNRIELVSLAVREICNEIGRFVGAQTTSNAYASFGPEAATNVHWDTHDVFVVQIGGRKRWRIYEPTHRMPISTQISNDRKHEVPDRPVIDQIVEEGDILYVPRGWWHRVEPVAGYETLHLTVAVHTPLILDYLVWACASVLPDLAEVRYSLLGEPHDAQRIAAALDAASAALRDPAALQSFYVRSRQRERVVSPFAIDSLFGNADTPLQADTVVAVNSRIADGKDLRINGDTAMLSGVHDTVLRMLADAASATVGAVRARLPGLADDIVDNVLKDLARIDLIRVLRAPTAAVRPPCELV